MPIFLDAMKCIECKNILEDPVILPCGDSVCRKHIPTEDGEVRTFTCKMCCIDHRVPRAGFPTNKVLEKFFKIGSEHNEAVHILR